MAARITKHPSYSYFDIELDGQNVGNFTVSYNIWFNNYPFSNFVSVEMYFNNRLQSINGISIAPEWQTCMEQNYDPHMHGQDVSMAEQLVNATILNASDYSIRYIPRRHAFNIYYQDGIINTKFFLVHEFNTMPQFKQVVLSINDNPELKRFIQFGISEDDARIIDTTIGELLRNK